MTIQLYHQSRTSDQIYLFQAKDSKTLTLKIYNLSQERIFKASVEINPSELQTLFKQPQTATFLKLFSHQHLPTPTSLSAPTLVPELFAELHKILILFKLQAPLEDKQTKLFICPITSEVFKDPVISNCGHTFEKSAIEEWLKKSQNCPSCRQPITTSFISNFQIKQALDTLQSQDPIPTFNLFKKESSTLAKGNLQMAETCLQEGEYQDAIDAYTLAFQYTKKWQDYQKFPSLYQQMGNIPKYHLALLYLAKYQLEAQATSEALQTLETLQQAKNPDISLSLCLLLIHLYTLQNKISPAVSLAFATAKTYEADHPSKAQLLYHYILHYDPHHWQAYSRLSKLLSSPREKAHLLLRGACHAIEAQNTSIAEQLCQEALENDVSPFLNHYPHLELLHQDPHRLTHKLKTLAGTYESQHAVQRAVKAYRYLITLDPQSSYYPKIVQLQAQLPKPHKALTWALDWLQSLLYRKDYRAAETLAQETLKLLSQHPTLDPIPLYEHLITLYTATQSPQLQEILTYLAEAHYKQGNIPLAEKLYRQAFEQFPTDKQAAALAHILEAQKDKIPEAVQIYYEAAILSLLREDLTQLNETLRHILQIDPLLKHLQTAQKAYLLTQKHLCQLKNDLDQTQNKLTETLTETRDQLSKAQNRISELEKERSSQQMSLISATSVSSQPSLTLLSRTMETDHVQTNLNPSPTLSQPSISIQPTVKAPPRPSIAFGAAEWKQYLGDVGAEPPLPSNIHQILQSPCPFWPDKKVQETHLLVLIPQTVNGKPLTMQSLGELVKTPKQGNKTQYRYLYLGKYTDSPAPASHWVLMTRDVLPDSCNKSYSDQQALVAGYAEKTRAPYQVPNILDATVCIFLEYICSGARLYSDNSWTYTRCQEKYDAGWQLEVGGFAAGGLVVGYGFRSIGSPGGVGALRKF